MLTKIRQGYSDGAKKKTKQLGKENNMEFTVFRTSDYYRDKSKKVTINSLEELLAFMHEAGHAIILAEPNGTYRNNYEIEIYDDYRE